MRMALRLCFVRLYHSHSSSLMTTTIIEMILTMMFLFILLISDANLQYKIL